MYYFKSLYVFEHGKSIAQGKDGCEAVQCFDGRAVPGVWPLTSRPCLRPSPPAPSATLLSSIAIHTISYSHITCTGNFNCVIC